jgi:ABC-2 type transport system permease protein
MYFQIFKHSINDTLAYRFGVFVRVVGMTLTLSVMYFVFKAYYAGLGGQTPPVPFATMISYLALAQFVGITHWNWVVIQTGEKVRSGKIAMELLRPWTGKPRILTIAAGGCVSNLLTSGLPLFVLYLAVFRVGAAFTVFSAIAFALSISFAFMARFYWNFMVASLTFYIENTWGLAVTSSYLVSIFSGMIIPLPHVPKPLLTVMANSPFPR